MPAEAEQPVAQLGPETFKAQCEECERSWEGHGTVQARRKAELAQKHANRMGHRVAAEWANRR